MTAAPSERPIAERPPYLAAGLVFLVVLTGYVYTLAPTVTFWDAGEFIAAARILGIPHPPGTPLFVLLGNFFGRLVPFGEFAWRTNLMTAMFSAAAAACMFLVVVQALRGWRSAEPEAGRDGLFVWGGAIGAALASAFAFTVWQNSNETEVYMVATFSIAAICWLAWLWRTKRGTMRASHLLLLIVYIGAVSIGNHLLTLLVGPALIAYVWHVLKTEPLPNEADRRAEWAQWAVLTGVWALLIGAGLGSTPLLVLGGIAFVAAAAYAASVGSLGFALAVVAIGAVGASTYLFLYVRAGLHPFINEADPSTWDALLSVIRREQYPPRSPLDNPVFPSGPDNPGRNLTIIGLQIQNYLQYFDWQWANGLETTRSVFALARMPFTLAFTTFGFVGLGELYRRDRSVFWLLLLLFLTTGPVLLGYMNFKPGYSLGWDLFPGGEQHEVRERDYFFTVSYQAWGMFAGIGLATLARALRHRLGPATAAARAGAMAVLALAALPLVLNFTAASRRHGPTASLARDFAYDMLQSVEPYGIMFTNGDNDTFPLWWAQEVEGIRPDVAVVNLSLGNTDWYIRQLRDNPVRRFEPAQAPWFANLAPAEPPPPLHSLSDAQIGTLSPQLLSQELTFRVGRVSRTFPRNTPIWVKDVLMMRLMQENLQRRPVYYSITAGSTNWLGLHPYMASEGLMIRVHLTAPPDSSKLVAGSVLGIPVNVPRTDSLVNHVYRYAGLFEADTLVLDPTTRNIATNLSLPFLALGQGLEVFGDRDGAVAALRRGYHLSPNADLKAVLDALTLTPLMLSDTAVADSGK
jgi:Protein O-mannosyl-transferase TMEM260-like